MTKTRCRKALARSFAGLCLVVFLVACGESPQRETAPPTPQNRVETPPPPAPSAVSAKTRETYQWYCTQCHGVEGKGNGINAQWVTVPPRNHTKAYYLETRSDQELFDTIKFGGLAMGRAPCMPAWGHTLDDTAIRLLVRYIRELCHCEAI